MFLVTFERWHGRHSLAHLLTSCLIVGQTTLEATAWRVRSTPGWPSPWIRSKTRLRHSNGIKGLGSPLEISTIMLWRPASTDLKFKPLLASSLRRLKSGSRGCRRATSSQSMPKSPMELMTQAKSVVAASSFAAEAFL